MMINASNAYAAAASSAIAERSADASAKNAPVREARTRPATEPEPTHTTPHTMPEQPDTSSPPSGAQNRGGAGQILDAYA
jgi:hypothetical protein